MDDIGRCVEGQCIALPLDIRRRKETVMLVCYLYREFISSDI